MADIKELTKKIIEFRDQRNWKQFHNPKDLAISLCLEAAELLEHFQWIKAEDMEENVSKNKNDIADEVADVLAYTLMLAHELDIDLEKAFKKKVKKNRTKYPVKMVKKLSKGGKHIKYRKRS